MDWRWHGTGSPLSTDRQLPVSKCFSRPPQWSDFSNHWFPSYFFFETNRKANLNAFFTDPKFTELSASLRKILFRSAQDQTRLAEEFLEEARAMAQPAEVISKLIDKIIRARNLRLAYIKRWLVTTLTYWLPARWLDRLLHHKLS